MAKPPVVLGAVSSAGILVEGVDGKLLLQFRRFDEDFSGLWSFPGGRVEDGDTPVELIVGDKLKGDVGFSADLWHVRVLDQVTVINNLYKPAELTLLRYGVPVFANELGRYGHSAPAWGFFSFEEIIMMSENGLLHPATAFAVDHIQRVKEEQGRCLLTEGQA